MCTVESAVLLPRVWYWDSRKESRSYGLDTGSILVQRRGEVFHYVSNSLKAFTKKNTNVISEMDRVPTRPLWRIMRRPIVIFKTMRGELVNPPPPPCRPASALPPCLRPAALPPHARVRSHARILVRMHARLRQKYAGQAMDGRSKCSARRRTSSRTCSALTTHSQTCHGTHPRTHARTHTHAHVCACRHMCTHARMRTRAYGAHVAHSCISQVCMHAHAHTCTQHAARTHMSTHPPAHQTSRPNPTKPCTRMHACIQATYSRQFSGLRDL